MSYSHKKNQYVHIKDKGQEEKLEWDNALLGYKLGS